LAAVKDKIMDLVDVKEEESVIEIDVQVLEFNKGATDTLGLSWPGSITFTEVGSPGISAVGTTWGRVFKVLDVKRAAFTLKLDALIEEGKARILSRPRLSCQSGKEAKLVVGGEVPILSSTVTGGGTAGTSATPGTVEYKEYGIILNIKPDIKESNRIHLNLEMQVSELGDLVTTSYASAYAIIKRTASTELFLDNNQTMAIGGLIKQKNAEDLRRVPWLSEIPVLGLFFRQKTTTRGGGSTESSDTELFIILTPRIVSQHKAETTKEKIKLNKELPSVEDDNILDPAEKYKKIIQQRILANLTYPLAAKEAGFQGTVKLSLKLSAQGDLLELKVKEPSNYMLLDDNAVKIAKKISPYPPFPPSIKEAQLWVDVPIIYQLE
jgi:TonB family protein